MITKKEKIMQNLNTKMTSDLEKLEKVIASCCTDTHLVAAKRMVYNYFSLYKQHLDVYNTAHIKARINRALDSATQKLTVS